MGFPQHLWKAHSHALIFGYLADSAGFALVLRVVFRAAGFLAVVLVAEEERRVVVFFFAGFFSLSAVTLSCTVSVLSADDLTDSATGFA